MVQVHPRDRYLKAVDALSDLFLLTGVRPPTPPNSLWQQVQRRMKPLAVAAVLIGMVGGGYLFRHEEQASALWSQIQPTHRSSEQALTLLRNVPIESEVDRMVISPANHILITAEADHILHLWSLPGGEPLQTLHGHTDSITVLEMNQDGSLLASGSKDQTIRIWDIQRGALLRTLSGHTEPITALAISPDQKTIASGGEDGVLHLWDLETGKLLRSFQTSSGIGAITYSTPDQTGVSTLISANYDQQIQVWNIKTGSLKRTFTGHTAPIVGLQMDNDHTLFSFGDDRTLVWDLEQEALVQVFSKESANLNTALLNQNQVVTVHNNGNVRVWSDEVGRLVATLPGELEPRLEAALSSDHLYLVSWSPNHQLQVWQMRSE
jgi:WD40 repeat protein